MTSPWTAPRTVLNGSRPMLCAGLSLKTDWIAMPDGMPRSSMRSAETGRLLMPSHGLRTSPATMSWGRRSSRVLLGTAKPIRNSSAP